MSLRISHLQQLDHVENLTLITKLIPPEDDLQRPLPPMRLKTFACAIDDPNSAWFSVFKSYYKDIDKLTVHCLTDKSSTEDALLKMIGAILDTTHATRIQQIKASFHDIHDFRLTVESVIMDIIYDYTIWDRRGIPLIIEFDIKYYDASVFVYPRNSFESTFSRSDKAHHRFKMIRSWSDDEKEKDEIGFLASLMNEPIHLQLNQLTITRVTHCLGPTPVFHLDLLLHQFPQLEYFSFTASKRNNINKKRLGRPEPMEGAEMLISKDTVTANRRFHPLQVLKMKSTKINRSVYHYLFKSCTRLRKLYLDNCYFKDDETVIAIEYFCLKHGVELIIIN